MLWRNLLFCLPFALAGCAAGFNRDLLRERLADGSIQITDASIAQARALKPQLKLPCRVAYHLADSSSKSEGGTWSAEDRVAFEMMAEKLKLEGIVSEIFALPEMLGGKGNLKELRMAAAKCGADVLLVVNGAAQLDKYKNPAALLYLTIVGGYVIPGNHVDALFMMEACLFDVDNEFVYASARGEGVGKIIRPTFIIEERDAITRAKRQAIGKFQEELLHKMRGLAQLPKQEQVAPGTFQIPETAPVKNDKQSEKPVVKKD